MAPIGPGRPHRPSRAQSASRVPEGRERIAWLLRVNRRYAGSGPDKRLASFAAAVSSAGCPASAGQISRWESGRVPVPYRVVAAYEKVLDLSLISVVDAVHRHYTPRAAPSRLDRRVCADDAAQARAQNLLDRVVTGGEMTGGDWDELTVLLTSSTNPLMPSRDWELLTQRLLTEQLVADGQAWRQRNEATHRLLWLPAARAHMVAACGAVVRDPASQVVVEPLVVLDVIDHPDAAALVAEQIDSSVSSRVLQGALLAAAVKVRLGQFSGPQLRRVTAAVRSRLADDGWPAALRPLALQVLGGRLSRVDTPLGHAPRVIGWVLGHTAGSEEPDEMLGRVVDEMLFSPSSDVRLQAAQLVGATPFRAALADACCAELRRSAVAREPALAEAFVSALPFVGGDGHRRTVEELVVAPGLAAADAAAWSLAHLPGRSSDAFWAAALPLELPGLIYALGVGGYRGWLARIAGDPGQPASARAAARWWSSLSTAVVR
jgi:hypothetical protein